MVILYYYGFTMEELKFRPGDGLKLLAFTLRTYYTLYARIRVYASSTFVV